MKTEKPQDFTNIRFCIAHRGHYCFFKDTENGLKKAIEKAKKISIYYNNEIVKIVDCENKLKGNRYGGEKLSKINLSKCKIIKKIRG